MQAEAPRVRRRQHRGSPEPVDKRLHESRNVGDRQSERAGTAVGLPEAEHHDVRLGVPGQPKGTTLTTLIDEDLAAARESDHLGPFHGLTVAGRGRLR